jgi:hypothetical protein
MPEPIVRQITGGAAPAVVGCEPTRVSSMLAASSGRGKEALNLALRHAKRNLYGTCNACTLRWAANPASSEARST